MRQTPGGYGIRFLTLPFFKKRAISRMLKKFYSLRYQVKLPTGWIADEKKIDACMLNISKGGCFLQADVTELADDVEGQAEFRINEREYLLPAKSVWQNRFEKFDKPVGFGVMFAKKQRKLIRFLKRQYGKLTAVR